jgi:hypothetical protein
MSEFNKLLHIYNGTLGICSTLNINKSCRGCNRNLASNDPASIYQKQKIIQGAVRINSSLYTMNLASLNSYQKPPTNYQPVEQAGTLYYVPPNLNWNQMSDRGRPSIQKVKTGSGSTYGSSSLRGTKVRNRPGAMSPGGIGVDIKHNSYERRLNKLKGRTILKQGIPKIADGQQMQGGKVLNPGIINGCDCSTSSEKYYVNNTQEFNDIMYDVRIYFNPGETILARKNKYDKLWYKGVILSIMANILVVDFGNGIIEEINSQLVPIIPYFRKNLDCLLPIDPTDPTDLLQILENNNICVKQNLLEAGVAI